MGGELRGERRLVFASVSEEAKGAEAEDHHRARGGSGDGGKTRRRQFFRRQAVNLKSLQNVNAHVSR